MAPGEKIWTYSMLGGYVAVDGTSIATAQVTGAVARILQTRRGADAEYVRKLLRSSSVRSEESQHTGVLNVRNAVRVAEGNATLDVNLAPKVMEKILLMMWIRLSQDAGRKVLIKKRLQNIKI